MTAGEAGADAENQLSVIKLGAVSIIRFVTLVFVAAALAGCFFPALVELPFVFEVTRERNEAAAVVFVMGTGSGRPLSGEIGLLGLLEESTDEGASWPV